MRTGLKRGIGTAAVLASGAAAARLATRSAAARLRANVDPDTDPLLVLPEGVVRHDIPTFDGGNVHVIEWGTGTRPLVLIHGVTLQAEVWSPLLHLLGERYRVYALDVRGHGASMPGSAGIGRRHAARDLATVLEHLDLRDAVVKGHSMGGMILGQFCGDFPEVRAERVAGVVFMNTAAGDLIHPRVAAPVRSAGARLRRRVEAGKWMPPGVGADDRSYLMGRVAFGARPSGAAVEQVRRLGQAVDERHYIPLWVDLLDTDNRGALAELDIPGLVLVGSRDALTPVRMARDIQRHLAGSELHVFPGAGHQLMQERPREVTELLIAFADRLDGEVGAASAAS